MTDEEIVLGKESKVIVDHLVSTCFDSITSSIGYNEQLSKIDNIRIAVAIIKLFRDQINAELDNNKGAMLQWMQEMHEDY